MWNPKTRAHAVNRCMLPVTGIRISLAFLLLAVLLIDRTEARQEQKKTIVCSTTQVADFARQIVGDRWSVVCVLGPAEDPHTYEVAADDGIAVAKADLCAENGWNLEGHDWMNKLATQAGKPVVTCISGVEPLKMDYGAEQVRDPHAWLSPKNAIIYVNNLCHAICELDPAHEDEYRARAELYVRQLGILNAWIKKTVVVIPANRRVLITHHDAFGYFCDEFNFKAVSPVGWTTAELTEVTPAQRQRVVKEIREIGVKSIFVETSTNAQLIQGIARDAGVKIGGQLYSDAMGPAGSAGETYVGMMRENVLTILRALK